MAPPTGGTESFSNPIAPANHKMSEEESRLTNADFRSLLMTPRATPSVAPPKLRLGVPKEFADADDAYAKRRKKKLYYAKLKKQEEEREKELNAKYRNRALERREGKNADYQHNDAPDLAKTAEYRAVAPTADQVTSAAERRRLAIQESKFLGGDMEHTHLVKGLDFALLQKVRSEIASLETMQPKEIEEAHEAANKKTEDATQGIEFQSITGRKIHKAALSNKPPARNELFLPKRMAYVFNLDDELDDSDIPTTYIRSKADCPAVENQATLTTNDIVINKLTQILSYLRHGMRASKKFKKREKELIRAGKDPRTEDPRTEDSIYGEIGDYDTQTANNQQDSQPSGKNMQSNYFSGKKDEEKSFNKTETNVKDFVQNIAAKYGSKSASINEPSAIDHHRDKKKPKRKDEVMDSYAECYPGAAEMADAVDDSDDDADYSKMDMGNKKGPVKRWDFENDDDYNKYMENRVAMPKAAFQFGIKMHEGRKTRTRPGKQTEKQKLDREWQQISSLIAKRKGGDGGPPSGKKQKDY
ncbi:protein Red isoform X2 [Hydra vulgaris]|uniref:Protein Red isoform X2 n=1 Tax=Hydra vulgaris TaxID=6087 RepID=A0ABM4D4H5_HYDVU